MAGNVEITANSGLMMPDQSLVIGRSLRLVDRPADETMACTLDMVLDGVLVFPNVTLPTDDDSDILLLVAGRATGYGNAYLNYGDSAYSGSADRTVCTGEMTLNYNVDQCTIMPCEVNAA